MTPNHQLEAGDAMRLVFITFLFTLIIESGLVHAHPTWPNEPPNSLLLVDCGFTRVDCDGQLWDVYNSGSIVQDSTAPFSPPGVGRASLFYPNTQGGIESWNVNSLKARQSHAIDWLTAEQPDVLLLQELKGTEFPVDAFRATRAIP
jgi:hypothetical protein